MDILIVNIKDGKIDTRDIEELAKAKPDGSYRLEVTKIRRTRSLDQNAWLWGCIYPLVMKGLVDAGWDDITTIEDVHELFKSHFAQRHIVNKQTGEILEIPQSTRQMDTVAFSAYCESIREYALEYLGIEIPDPDPTL